MKNGVSSMVRITGKKLQNRLLPGLRIAMPIWRRAICEIPSGVVFKLLYVSRLREKNQGGQGQGERNKAIKHLN
jgi:hypothetical protein